MEDRTFIVWSTGAVRAERIERIEVREQRVTLLLNCGKELTVPAGDLDDVRKQLGLGAACAAAAAMSAPPGPPPAVSVYEHTCVKAGPWNMRSGRPATIDITVGDVTRRLTKVAASKLRDALEIPPDDTLRCVGVECSHENSASPPTLLTFVFADGKRERVLYTETIGESDFREIARNPHLWYLAHCVPGMRGADEPRPVAGRRIPPMYTDAKLRCVLGPDPDGSVGLGIDFPGVGATIRVRLSGDHAAWLASQVAGAQPQRSQSPSSSGIPSFEASDGTR